MAKSKYGLTVARILEIIDGSVDEWVKEQKSESTIRQKVFSQLNGSMHELCLMALGGRKGSFDRVELDTRAPGYALIKEAIEATARQWLAENVDKFATNLTQSDLTGFQRHYKESYDKYLKDCLAARARERAQQDADIIMDGVGLSTDKLKTALEDLITEDEKHEAIIQAAKGKSFDHRSRVESAEVVAVVAYDGETLSDRIQDPHAVCWHVMHLMTASPNIECYILTDGDEWHPVEARFGPDGIDTLSGPAKLSLDRTKVLESFTSARQLMFNYMDETDKLVICNAISRHYTPDDDIPF